MHEATIIFKRIKNVTKSRFCRDCGVSRLVIIISGTRLLVVRVDRLTFICVALAVKLLAICVVGMYYSGSITVIACVGGTCAVAAARVSTPVLLILYDLLEEANDRNCRATSFIELLYKLVKVWRLLHHCIILDHIAEFIDYILN